MARRAFSSTSSSDAAGAGAADDLPPAEGAAAGAAVVPAAAGAGAEEPLDMKNQAPPAAASTATTMPMSITGDLPDFSSPPELEDGAVTALSASAVDEIRAASLIARNIGAASTGESTSACMAPSSISASTVPAEALSRIAMTTGL